MAEVDASVKNRILRPAPRNPSLVSEIIRLREVEGLSWRKIGKLLEISHQSPFLLYSRWRHRKWAQDNIDEPARADRFGTLLDRRAV